MTDRALRQQTDLINDAVLSAYRADTFTAATSSKNSEYGLQLYGIWNELSATTEGSVNSQAHKVQEIRKKPRKSSFDSAAAQHALQKFLKVSANRDATDENAKVLEWAIVGVATTQVYRNVVTRIKAQTLPLAQDLLYWDSVLKASGYKRAWRVGLYQLQHLPFRVWDGVKWCWSNATIEPWKNALNSGVQSVSWLTAAILTGQWNEIIEGTKTSLDDSIALLFNKYHLCKHSIKYSATGIWLFIRDPWLFTVNEIKYKHDKIKTLRDQWALSLGYLVASPPTHKEWQLQAKSNVEMLALVINPNQDLNSNSVPVPPSDFNASSDSDPRVFATKLLDLVQTRIPENNAKYNGLTGLYGTPSFLTRNWPLYACIAVGSVITAQSVIGNWDAITTWTRTTIVDTSIAFYQNWILEPLTKIYYTIRHDDNARIAIVTKESLDADLRSLERMVVDFANSTSHSSAEVEEIRQAVQQGDLTAVLLPYEKQIQTPLKSLVTGKLVQALLIQIQKTKVDAETAMAGIDKLLKSQELVFGVVAALPSLAITSWASGWVYRSMINPGATRARASRSETRIEIANTVAKLDAYSLDLKFRYSAQKDPETYYQTVGLYLCKAGLLKELGAEAVPGRMVEQWIKDTEDLEELSMGYEYQRKVFEKIYGVYGNLLLR